MSIYPVFEMDKRLKFLFILFTVICTAAEGANTRRFSRIGSKGNRRGVLRLQNTNYRYFSPEGRSIMETLAALKGGLIGGSLGSLLGSSAGQAFSIPAASTSPRQRKKNKKKPGGICLMPRGRRRRSSDGKQYYDEYIIIGKFPEGRNSGFTGRKRQTYVYTSGSNVFAGGAAANSNAGTTTGALNPLGFSGGINSNVVTATQNNIRCYIVTSRARRR